MQEQQFWAVVERSRGRISSTSPEGNMGRQLEDLKSILKQLSTEEIVKFDDLFQQKKERAMRWDLWAAADLVAEGCSEDGFSDFCNWLISLGEKPYEAALENPDSLIGPVLDPSVEDVFFPELGVAALETLEARNQGESLSWGRPIEPTGTPLESDEDKQRALPLLWERFGE